MFGTGGVPGTDYDELIVANKDKVLSLEALGFADLAAGKPMRPDNLFWIASMTKPVTATAVLMLQEEGRLSVDDPVAKYLPTDVKMPQRGGKQITLIDLATHTSGLPGMPSNFAPKDIHNPYADYTVANLFQFPTTRRQHFF